MSNALDLRPAAKPLVEANDAAGQSLFSVLARAAADPAVNVEKMEGLYQLMQREEDRIAERAFNAAMTAAQTEIRPVATDTQGDKSRYASYLALDKAVRPIYTKHGLSLSFNTEAAGESMVRVLCYVAHRDGHSRTYSVDMPADGKGAKGNDVMTKTHAAGSAMSYGVRYLLKLIFNIAIGEDDDDGNKAGDTNAKISLVEVGELTELAARANVDLERLCNHLKIDALAALPKKRLGDVREILNIELNTYQAKKAAKK